MTPKEKLNIDMHEYYHNCGDGCCTDYGTIIKVNGVELASHNQDAYTILKNVLEFLGYEVEINETFEGDNE
jgi:hypothetical protein